MAGAGRMMTRRRPTRSERSALLFALVLATSCSPDATPPGPNIVLINLDDARSDGLDRMPTVQSRLVANGISFTNSFTPSSVCCPSRASLLTGLYALNHGTRAIYGPIGGADRFRENGADQRTLAVWLQNAGYRTKGVIHIFRSAELDSHVRFQDHNIGSSGITSCMLSPHTLAEVVFRTHGVFDSYPHTGSSMYQGKNLSNRSGSALTMSL